MTGKINRAQAVAMARKLYKEGVHAPKQLAEKLAAAGFVSEYTGKPLSPGGAYSAARTGIIRRRRKAAATPTRPVLTARKAAATPTRPKSKRPVIPTRSHAAASGRAPLCSCEACAPKVRAHA
jgi:hypothetical protein